MSGFRRERRSVAASEASQHRGFDGSVAASQRIYPIDQVRLLRAKYLISYFLSNSQDANGIWITYA